MQRIMTMAAAGLVLIACQSQPRAQQIYPTPEAAAKDLIDSARAEEPGFGNRILGAQGAALLRSGDAKEDASNLAQFNEAAAETMALDEKDGNTRLLRVGARGWTFPLPILKKDDGWRFDPAQGSIEIANRLIGFNELSAIGACRAYVKAQDEFYAMDRDGDAIREYAGKIVSTPGKHDGLYWDAVEQSDISPLDGFVAAMRRKPTPGAGVYNGYVFRILTAQGPAAPGGAHSYRINGSLIAGHALVAWPEEWGKTGVQTFVCGQNGKVFQKNLGPKTGTLGPAIRAYNPDPSWSLVD